MKKSEVTQLMKNLMSEVDRQEIFGASLPSPLGTSAAAKPKRDMLTRAEKQDHIDVENWCRQHDLFVVHSRMDKATRNEKGIPDFVIGIKGRLVAIELKRFGNKLTPDQEEQRRKCEGPSGCEYHICYSSAAAIEILQHLIK